MNETKNGTPGVSDKVARAAAFFAISVSLLLGALVFVDRQPQGDRNTSTNSKEGILEKVKKSGELRVALVTAPPITKLNPSTKTPEGYAVDVIEAVAKNSDLKITYIPSDWGSVSAELSAGNADIAIGPIFLTEGRAKEFSFTDPLFAYAIVAAVPVHGGRVNAKQDLQLNGVRVAVGRGGFDNEFVKKFMPNAKASVFPPGDASLPMLEVLAGRADLAFVDYATGAAFVREHPDVKLLFVEDPISVQYAGFMAPKDLFFVEFINIALRNLDLSGELDAIDEKYASERTWYGRISSRNNIKR